MCLIDDIFCFLIRSHCRCRPHLKNFRSLYQVKVIRPLPHTLSLTVDRIAVLHVRYVRRNITDLAKKTQTIAQIGFTNFRVLFHQFKCDDQFASTVLIE